jgi:hypothetical protein
MVKLIKNGKTSTIEQNGIVLIFPHKEFLLCCNACPAFDFRPAGKSGTVQLNCFPQLVKFVNVEVEGDPNAID